LSPGGWPSGEAARLIRRRADPNFDRHYDIIAYADDSHRWCRGRVVRLDHPVGGATPIVEHDHDRPIICGCGTLRRTRPRRAPYVRRSTCPSAYRPNLSSTRSRWSATEDQRREKRGKAASSGADRAHPTRRIATESAPHGRAPGFCKLRRGATWASSCGVRAVSPSAAFAASTSTWRTKRPRAAKPERSRGPSCP
jgi:hypothetical protein